ncbi:FecCD family ABC transporter permease [Phaeacidiphilus oryzae]|uniref:FecCD family ABC transporter permease n=1 Tax=Phaeacidiphilus oryzae TaxID=348818 RepID=UPI0005688E3A|nr:iron ABC transporter permease [Phaeacidiphilus oryzae]
MSADVREPAVRPAGYALTRRGRASFLTHRRSLLLASSLLVLLAAAMLLSLCVGETLVAPSHALRVVLGGQDPDGFTVGTLRLPRVVLGALVGAAFGVSGALVQTVARNPLASPDVIGISHGASAVTVGLLAYGVVDDTAEAALAAVAGGVATAALVWGTAWRRGINAQRFVLIGVGISIALGAVTQLFLTKGDALQAEQAKVWMSGSLNGAVWSQSWPVLGVLAVVACALPWAARAQRVVGLDDLTATSLGVRLGRSRLGLAALGVLAASIAVGASGPVDFVALVAPQVALRLARTAQIPLASSALGGALLVVLADLLARTALDPTELPVGVVTAFIGAPYLMWLLVRGRPGQASRG